jgi:hypothetical protein
MAEIILSAECQTAFSTSSPRRRGGGQTCAATRRGYNRLYRQQRDGQKRLKYASDTVKKCVMELGGNNPA